MESDWFYYKQAGMLLGKYENFIKLTVNNTIKFSKFNFPRPDFGMWKTKC